MAMQTDVKAKNIVATGASGVGKCRIKAVYFVGTATGSISIKDGGSGGTERLVLGSGVVGNTHILFPGEGISYDGDPYITLTTVANVTFFYG